MSNLNSSLPLAGVRILDLSRVLAGPWCAMVLGDLGAEIIKVEHPKRGDDTRDWGLRVGASETTYFNSVNRNKRSVCLDLQTPEGQRLARELAQQSDVVIQNFKYGGAEKLGLGYEQLSQGARISSTVRSPATIAADRKRHVPATTWSCRARRD